MADDCCSSACGTELALSDARWRRILWIALGLNVAMFAAESIAGVLAHSRSLQADALDFLGDAANYAISLGVAGMALHWRARAAWAKGLTILLFGLAVLVSAARGYPGPSVTPAQPPSPVWQTASTLLPSGSRTNAP